MQAGSLLTLNFYPCDNGATACAQNNGNIWRQTVQSSGMSGTATQEYRYDNLNRLAVAAENPSAAVSASSTCGQFSSSWCQSLGYDIYGNRWVSGYAVIPPVADTPVASTNFDASNRLTVNGSQSNAVGNLQQMGSEQFSYDAENRLVSTTVNSVTVSSNTYDGEGWRVQKVPGGTTTTYLYDAPGELAAEYAAGGTLPPAPCTTCYLHTDHLGSTRLMTNASGGVVSMHDYQPFGEEIAAGTGGRSSSYGQTDNPKQKFTGKERDSELANLADPWGLDFFGARYFSGAQGRLTNPDQPLIDQFPQDPQRWNMYSYGRNDPLKYTDPTGQAVQVCTNDESGKQTCVVMSDPQCAAAIAREQTWHQCSGRGSQCRTRRRSRDGWCDHLRAVVCGSATYQEESMQDTTGDLVAIGQTVASIPSLVRGGAALGRSLMRGVTNLFSREAGTVAKATVQDILRGAVLSLAELPKQRRISNRWKERLRLRVRSGSKSYLTGKRERFFGPIHLLSAVMADLRFIYSLLVADTKVQPSSTTHDYR